MTDDHASHTSVTVRVEGRVQGVNYRAAARQQAADLGIDAVPVNLDDGSVRIDVSGDRDKVRQFIDWCWQGPRLASVSAVHVEDAS